MASQTRRRFLQLSGAVGALGLAGCTGGSNDTGPDDATSIRGGAEPSPVQGRRRSTGDGSATTGGTGDAPTPPLAERRLPIMYEYDRLRRNVQSGGPGKDGIPSIDDPQFIEPSAGDRFLDPGDVVFGYAGETDVKAYPQSILVWHEIVNDTLDGVPTSVTYCPLTGTVLGFDRGETTFGVSGQLLNNNLIMYDRGTDSRWPQVLATAIAGRLEGHSLTETRLVWTTWQQWKAEHPETQVLSEDTGHARNYNRDPYGQYNPKRGYYAGGSTLFAPLTEDDRYPPKEVVLGARVPEGAMAFLKSALADAGVLEATLGGTTYTAVHDGRLDTGYVYDNPDGVGVSRDGNAVVIDGDRHRPDALPLDPVHAFDAMWFAWSGFYPETVVAA